MGMLLKHKDDKPVWSAFDWLNYKPPTIDKTPDWKNCKLLGTEKEINRRTGLTIDSMREMKYIYKSKAFSMQMKVRTFEAFSASVFLYNSELWTLTATLKKKMDSFHGRMLRQAIHIRWPYQQLNCTGKQMLNHDWEAQLAWPYDEAPK